MDPTLCEGYCVRCGQPVEPTSGAPKPIPKESGLSFRESLSVGWLFVWRGAVAAAAVAAGLSFLISSTTLNLLLSLLVGFSVSLPWAVRRMTSKQFRGFYFVVVRQPKG